MSSLSLVDTIVIAIVVPVVVLIGVIALITCLLYRRRVQARRERQSARAAAATPTNATPQHKHHRTHEYDRVHRKPPSRRGQYVELPLAPAAATNAVVPPQEYGPMVFNKRTEYRQSMAHKSPSSRRRHVKDRPAAALPPPVVVGAGASDARRSFVDRPPAPLPQQQESAVAPPAGEQWIHVYDTVPKRHSSRKQLLHRGQRSKRSRRRQPETHDSPPAVETTPPPTTTATDNEPAPELLDATVPAPQQRKRPSSVNLTTLTLTDDDAMDLDDGSDQD
jgi:hypothetical protein